MDRGAVSSEIITVPGIFLKKLYSKPAYGRDHPLFAHLKAATLAAISKEPRGVNIQKIPMQKPYYILVLSPFL